jgi:hypothetical protein
MPVRTKRKSPVPSEMLISCIGPGVVTCYGRTVSVLFIELALGLYPRFEAVASSEEEAVRHAKRLRAALEANPGAYHVTFEGVKRFLTEHGVPLQWTFRNEEFPAGSPVGESAAK